MFQFLGATGIVGLAGIFCIGFLAFIRFFRKVELGSALIRTGYGETEVAFSGMFIFPIIHRYEIMDISVKRIEISRVAQDGLICKDNMRADIKVAFFVRVNPVREDVIKVAESLSCERASQEHALIHLFDAKFSEALKTAGKKFDFVDLYTKRTEFKESILETIGTDLNGYILDDAAIDYLEQTPLETLNPDNIMDVEGIKKITDLTAQQQILANHIRREKEKTIKKQDVEAREAVLMLERQQTEAEQKQLREISDVQSREQADAQRVKQQERLKAEQARITTEEEIGVAEANRERKILVATKNKERTEAVETERVEKDRALEENERLRIVELAQIEKEKALEVERKAIQDVIRERIVVERAVVEEQQKIKDTEEFAVAERERKVAVINAEREAEEALVKQVKEAEASKQSAQFLTEQQLIEAEADRAAAEKKSEAVKMMSEAKAAEEAAVGLAAARVQVAKAEAFKKEGEARAEAIRMEGSARAESTQGQGLAEAEVQRAQGESSAHALEARGLAEAKAVQTKLQAEASGIKEKAEAMKLLDGVGREHEEFKLQLAARKEIQLAEINIREGIAKAQATVMGEALKSARIDIVGGETKFFSSIMESISNGKRVDRMFDNSETLTAVRDTFFNGDSERFKTELQRLVGQFGLTSDSIKNLSIAGLINKMSKLTDDPQMHGTLKGLLDAATAADLNKTKAATLIDAPKAS